MLASIWRLWYQLPTTASHASVPQHAISTPWWSGLPSNLKSPVLHRILHSKADMSVVAPFNHRADALRGTLPAPETKGSDGRQRHSRAAQLVLKAMFRPPQWNPAT